MKLPQLFRVAAIEPHRLRMEIFALGDRHQGDPLAGARLELDSPRLSAERRVLLRAVVAHLASEEGTERGAGPQAPRSVGLSNAAYVGVIACAVAWTLMIVRSLPS